MQMKEFVDTYKLINVTDNLIGSTQDKRVFIVPKEGEHYDDAVVLIWVERRGRKFEASVLWNTLNKADDPRYFPGSTKDEAVFHAIKNFFEIDA